jgi:hypothetical protein
MKRGIRLDSSIGLLVLAGVLVAFGVVRLVNHDAFGWLLIGGGALASYGAWWMRGRAPEG